MTTAQDASLQTPDSLANGFVGQLQALRDKRTLVDFQIICKGRTWDVHRLVLAIHSKVLERACDGEFKEAQIKKLDLSAHEETDVDCLVGFMYSLKYDTGVYASQDATTGLAAALVDLRMFAMADKYDIVPLQNQVTECLRSKINPWNLDIVRQESKVVAKVIEAAYESSAPPSIRELIVSKIAISQVLAHEDTAAVDILGCFESCPQFAKDLAVFMSKYGSREIVRTADCSGKRWYRCYHCFEHFEDEMHTLMRRGYSGTIYDASEYSCEHCGRLGTASQWAKVAAA